jgi:glutaminase
MKSKLNSLTLQVAMVVLFTFVLSATVFAQSADKMLTKANIEAALNDAYSKYKELKEGKNADYIPELAKVNSELYGLALVTVNGQVYLVGDVADEFSIQSISKVITMARVIEDEGEQFIEDRIGVDPTGARFNSAIPVEMNKGMEINPMVNAGAIAATSLVRGKTYEEKWNAILQTHNDFAARQLVVNEPVYKSEAATNQHNQALAVLMLSFERMYFDPPQAVDIYTKQCAINVNVKDLAVMAATLANGGVNPVSKKKVVSPQTVMHVLPVMAICGLYDDSGIWYYNVGMPAKSGVGGGIMAVDPGKFGIAVFSPRLDAAGNSVKAQKAIYDIMTRLSANPFLVQPK